MDEYTADHRWDIIIDLICTVSQSVFCPGFQKGRVPSEKGTFSAVSGPSKGHNYRGELKKKGIISAVNVRKRALFKCP